MDSDSNHLSWEDIEDIRGKDEKETRDMHRLLNHLVQQMTQIASEDKVKNLPAIGITSTILRLKLDPKAVHRWLAENEAFKRAFEQIDGMKHGLLSDRVWADAITGDNDKLRLQTAMLVLPQFQDRPTQEAPKQLPADKDPIIKQMLEGE